MNLVTYFAKLIFFVFLALNYYSVCFGMEPHKAILRDNPGAADSKSGASNLSETHKPTQKPKPKVETPKLEIKRSESATPTAHQSDADAKAAKEKERLKRKKKNQKKKKAEAKAATPTAGRSETPVSRSATPMSPAGPGLSQFTSARPISGLKAVPALTVTKSDSKESKENPKKVEPKKASTPTARSGSSLSSPRKSPDSDLRSELRERIKQKQSKRKGRRPSTPDLTPDQIALATALEIPAHDDSDEEEEDSPFDQLQQAIVDGEWNAFEAVVKNRTPESIRFMINKKDDAGFAAIHYAAREKSKDQMKFLKYLLEHGADINDMVDENGDDEDRNHTPLLLAARKGLLDIVKYLYKLAPALLKTEKPKLHYESNGNQFAVVTEIFESDSKELTKAQRELIIKFLIEEAGAIKVDAAGYTPLHLAAEFDYPGLIPVCLAKGIPVDARVDNGDAENDWHLATALHVAAHYRNFNIVKSLVLEHKAPVNIADDQGTTPLLEALGCHDSTTSTIAYNIIPEFLIENGADLHAQSGDGSNALHLAAQEPSLTPFVHKLLDKKVKFTKNQSGMTPLDYAAKKNSAETLKVFIDMGCPCDEPVHAEDKDCEEQLLEGKTPLFIAAEDGAFNSVKTLLSPEFLEAKKVTIDYVEPKTKYTPLLISAKNGRADIAKLLIGAGADVMVTMSDGSNITHFLARYNSCAELVGEIISKKPELNRPDQEGYFPIHHAAARNAYKVIQVLAKSKYSNIEEPVKAAEKKDATQSEGNTPLLIATKTGALEAVQTLVNECRANMRVSTLLKLSPLHCAVNNKSEKVVVFLCQAMQKQGISLDHTEHKEHETALHLAARKNLTDMARILIAHGAKKTAVTTKGLMPVHLAAMHNSLAVLKELTGHGGAHKATSADDQKLADHDQRTTPLMLAAKHNKIDAVRFLLRYIKNKINDQNKQGATALYLAALHGADWELVDLLLKAGANMNVRTRDGYSSLDAAAENGHLHVINCFIEHIQHQASDKRLATIWTDEKNPLTGETPLMLATRRNQEAVCNLLFKTNINVKARNKFTGRNALHDAADHNYVTLVKMLVEKDSSLIESETLDGFTPLMLAARKGHNNVIAHLKKAGASLSKKVSNNTALNLAIMNKKNHTIAMLLDMHKKDTEGKAESKRALSEISDNKGCMPLHIAAEIGNTDAAQILMKFGARIDACSSRGLLPIHTAASCGQPGMVELLLKAGTDINVLTKFSRLTPLMLAKDAGHKDTVALLIQQKAMPDSRTAGTPDTKSADTKEADGDDQDHGHQLVTQDEEDDTQERNTLINDDDEEEDQKDAGFLIALQQNGQIQKKHVRFLRSRALPAQDQQALIEALDALFNKPDTLRDVKKEKDNDLTRIRCGIYRIEFYIEESSKKIIVTFIGLRRDAYKN